MKRQIATVLLICTTVFAIPAIAGHHPSHGKAGKETEHATKGLQHSAANIVDTAAAAGQFETLIAAAKAAGLVSALTGDGPLTVFAPTDEAFGALPAGTIETLLKPENKQQLAEILKYHVIAGKVGSGALADGASLEMLSGGTAVITESEKGFTIEGARIVTTDIHAANGVVHVIDRVIMPKQRMSRADVMNLIDMAIGSGAPMYNHGNPRGTVEIYATAARSMLTSNSDLTRSEKALLMQGLSESMGLRDPRDQAWRLRYALDDVSASLMPMPTSNRAQIR